MHTYTPADSIFDGPITNLVSILCISVEILSRVYARDWGGGGGHNGFRFGAFIGHFPSDGAGSMAVKGLIPASFGPTLNHARNGVLCRKRHEANFKTRSTEKQKVGEGGTKRRGRDRQTERGYSEGGRREREKYFVKCKNEERQTDSNRETGREAERQTDRQRDRQADRQAGRQAGRQTGRQAGRDRQADRQTDRQAGRQRGRLAGRQRDRLADRQASRQAGRETDREGENKRGISVSVET